MTAPFLPPPGTDTAEYVLLVDAEDQVTGLREKMAAHREGLLHRAFSVFVFTPDGRHLLQQRAASKYHSGGLWSNTCVALLIATNAIQESDDHLHLARPSRELARAAMALRNQRRPIRPPRARKTRARIPASARRHSA